MTLFTPATMPAQRLASFDEQTRLWRLARTSHRLHHWHETQARLQALPTAFADTPFAGPYRQLGERTDHHRAIPSQPLGRAHTFDSK